MNTINLQTTLTYVVTALNRRFVKEGEAKPVGLPFRYIDQAAMQLAEQLPEYIQKCLNGRFERGLTIAVAKGVSMDGDPFADTEVCRYWVESSRPFNPPYRVDLQAGTCTCPDAAKGYFCKHRIAAHIIHIGRKLWLEQQQAAPPEAALPKSQPEVAKTPPANAVQPGEMKTSSAKPAPPEKIETPPANTPPLKEAEAPVADATTPRDDNLIWAIIRVDGKLCGVEVLDIQGDQVTVKALPSVTPERKLKPCFPFAGKRTIATVHKSELSNVKVFR